MKSFLQYRKTALLVCAVLCSFFVVHLVGAYIYSGGKYVGLPGGGVSVGVVSDSRPKPLNPLLYGNGEIDDMLYKLLFRSLIRYNPATEIYEWDLAYCDIKNISEITCKLTEDAIWSDGTKVTTEDVIATFDAFKEHATISAMKTVFANAKVKSGDDNTIIITSSNKNYNIIEALSYPIIRSDVIDQIKNNRLKKESYITSGPFIFEDETDDSEYNYHNIILAKNPNYQKTVWLNNFRLKIFPDLATLQRGISVVEIVIPPLSQENLNLSASFKKIDVRNYEFYGNFLNTDRIDPNLRAILVNYLSARFKENGPEVAGQIPTQSIFLSGAEVTGKTELPMSLQDFMNDKGYKKKWSLLNDAYAIETTLTSGAKIPKMQYFRNGNGYAILYSDDPAGEISLNGVVPNTTTSVTINGYTLQEYSAGSTTFVYKISTALGTIKDGKNTYNLELTQKDGSVLKETLTIYHTTDKAKMEEYKQSVDTELLAELNSEEKIAERETAKQEKIAQIQALEDNLYYNADYEPFSLKLTFVSDREASLTYADFTISSLRQLGIVVEADPIDTKALNAMIKSGTKSYDMIIVGVRSPNTIADLGTAFFSSESGNPNFSNITSKNFVDNFKELKNTADKGAADELKQKIIDFMNQQNFYLPISQPVHKIYMHMDVKWMHMPDIIPNTGSLAYIFDVLSKREEYQKNTEGKNISGFFSWFANTLSPQKN